MRILNINEVKKVSGGTSTLIQTGATETSLNDLLLKKIGLATLPVIKDEKR